MNFFLFLFEKEKTKIFLLQIPSRGAISGGPHSDPHPIVAFDSLFINEQNASEFCDLYTKTQNYTHY